MQEGALDPKSFHVETPPGGAAGQEIVTYDPANEKLWYGWDNDPSYGVYPAPILFAIVDYAPALSASDFIVI